MSENINKQRNVISYHCVYLLRSINIIIIQWYGMNLQSKYTFSIKFSVSPTPGRYETTYHRVTTILSNLIEICSINFV